MATDAPNLAGSRLWRKAPTRNRHIHIEGSYFEWIESTDEPEFEEIRRRMEMLWLRVPEGQRAEYEARLRSKRCTDFFSAYSELWYQQALEEGGLRCFAPENTPAGSLPDWQVWANQRPAAIAECYLRMQPEKDLRDDFVQRRWFDGTLKKLKNKRIRLWIHERRCGQGQPSADRLAKQLDALVESSLVQKSQGLDFNLGRYSYEDSVSGWLLDFTLFLRQSRSSNAVAQLLYCQSDGASWCQGENLFEAALSRKARQHSPSLPVLICVGWNYFKHEPDFEDVRDIVAKRAASLDEKGVCGVYWARELYPWNLSASSPRLLHWGAAGIDFILSSWNGGVVDVRNLD